MPFSEQIELRGHIIDSLILPKVLDESLTCGGTFTLREIKIGKQQRAAQLAEAPADEVFPQSSTMAVHLDLIFLGLTFRGRFLMIDQSDGILG
jgi:hypothetical protein